jgi:hypothetical protein
MLDSWTAGQFPAGAAARGSAPVLSSGAYGQEEPSMSAAEGSGRWQPASAFNGAAVTSSGPGARRVYLYLASPAIRCCTAPI